MISKACPVCGKLITSERLYCSIECKAKGQTKRVEIVCYGCGKNFKILPYLQRKTNYCSANCYHNSTKTKITKICPVCKRSFLVKAYLIKQGFGIHCSQKCFVQTYITQRKTQSCNQCGKVFTRALSLSSKYPKAFCSKKCHDDFRREYVSITCVNCSKIVKIPQSVINRGKGRFCSWYCYTHFRGETSIEKIVKNQFEKANIPYRQEVKIGKYHADFMIENSNILLECDGDYWHSLTQAIAKDQKRDLFLHRLGYQVIRFTESDIKKTKGHCVINRLADVRRDLLFA